VKFPPPQCKLCDITCPIWYILNIWRRGGKANMGSREDMPLYNTKTNVPHVSIATPCFQRLLQYKIVLQVPWSGAPYSFLRQWRTTWKHWSWTTRHPTLTALHIWIWQNQTNFLTSPSEILRHALHLAF